MSYVYKRTEPFLWTVGAYAPDGSWQPDSDHDNPQDAARRAAWLNGSGEPTVPAGLVFTPRDKRTILAALADAAAYRQDQAARWCEDCQDAASGPCDDHTGDLDQAGTYQALARRIGGQS